MIAILKSIRTSSVNTHGKVFVRDSFGFGCVELLKSLENGNLNHLTHANSNRYTWTMAVVEACIGPIHKHDNPTNPLPR